MITLNTPYKQSKKHANVFLGVFLMLLKYNVCIYEQYLSVIEHQ